MRIEATLQASVSDQYSLSAAAGEDITVEPALAYVKQELHLIPYEGSYEVTPSDQPQTLPTEMKEMIRDLVINPIPSNYGLITWNGTTLTVS